LSRILKKYFLFLKNVFSPFFSKMFTVLFSLKCPLQEKDF
jgi:hypothetical protein